MKHFLLPLIIIAALILGCGLPYQGAVFSQIEYSNDLNQVVNELGSKLSRGEKLGPVASRDIRDAVDDQVRANSIALYALEQYQLQQGLFGYSSLELALKDLKEANEKIVRVVHKYAKQEDEQIDEDSEALLELFKDLSKKQRDAILSKIGG